MTADEMFKRLGYERDSTWDGDGDFIAYKQAKRNPPSTYIIIGLSLGIVECKVGRSDAHLNFNEIKAVAKFLEERGL